MDNKLETISNLFECKEIRSVWDVEKEEYYFSVVDVIKSLTDSNNPNDYWYRLKKRMTEEEKSELSTKCRQLKLRAKDGNNFFKNYVKYGIIQNVTKYIVAFENKFSEAQSSEVITGGKYDSFTENSSIGGGLAYG